MVVTHPLRTARQGRDDAERNSIESQRDVAEVEDVGRRQYWTLTATVPSTGRSRVAPTTARGSRSPWTHTSMRSRIASGVR